MSNAPVASGCNTKQNSISIMGAVVTLEEQQVTLVNMLDGLGAKLYGEFGCVPKDCVANPEGLENRLNVLVNTNETLLRRLDGFLSRM